MSGPEPRTPRDARRHTARIALAAGVALAIAARAVSAHVISDRDVKLFQAMPRNEVASGFAGALPDSAGRVGPNRDGWRHVVYQQDALLLLIDAAARADTAAAERAWRAVDAIFEHQRPDSMFASSAARGETLPGDPAATLALLGTLCRAQVALENSPLRARFHWRVVLMLPKLRRSLEALATRGDAFARASARDPQALIAGAQAFLLGDGIFHVEALGLLGQRLLVDGLALQKSSGQFVSKGRDPVATQAGALLALQAILNYYPAPSLERAAAQGGSWLAGQAKRSSRTAGDARVRLALACAAAQPGILRSTPAARVVDR